MTNRDLVVVKFGSESVTNHSGIDRGSIHHHAKQISRLPHNVIVVSSGAVKAGEARWRQRNGSKPVSRETLATLGSAPMAIAWDDAFDRQNILSSQMLVTHQEIKDPREGPKFKQTLSENLRAGIVTVLNENDAVNDEEMVQYLLGGDNDELAYEVGKTMGASALALMTNVPGLLNSEGEVISQVLFDNLDHEGAKMFAGEANEAGQGMPTKVGAAIEAAKLGIDAYIAQAGQNLEAVLSGETGTHFVARAQDM